MHAQVDALVAAANKGDATAVAQFLDSKPALASASREINGQTEKCPALARAAAMGHVDIVRLLLKHGADPNAMYREDYGTALTAACETLAPRCSEVVAALIDAGADVGMADAAFVAISTWARNPVEKHKVVKMLSQMGETGDQHPAVLAIHMGDAKLLTSLLARDPGLIGKKFSDVGYLSWPVHLGAPTLMHIAADMGEVALVQLLIQAGADVNARSGAGENGCGYQTPAFHCVASANGSGLGVLKLLLEQRADLGITAKVHFPEESAGVVSEVGQIINLNPLGLALKFENGPKWRNSAEAVKLLRAAGAVE